MIILEGPDLAGKTSLANALFATLSATKYAPMVRHFTRVKQHFDKYWGYRQCIQRDVILDRFHMSHVAYRKMDGENHNLTPFRYSLIDADITKIGGIVVVLLPSEATIKSRWNDMPSDRQEMFSLSQVLRVRDVYNEIVNKRMLMTNKGEYTFKIDYHVTNDTWSTQKIATEVSKLWVERQAELEDIASWRPLDLD